MTGRCDRGKDVDAGIDEVRCGGVHWVLDFWASGECLTVPGVGGAGRLGDSGIDAECCVCMGDFGAFEFCVEGCCSWSAARSIGGDVSSFHTPPGRSLARSGRQSNRSGKAGFERHFSRNCGIRVAPSLCLWRAAYAAEPRIG